MAWIDVSITDLVTTGEGDKLMVVASVEIVIFSLDMDGMFVEGDIMRNRVFLGILDFSSFNRRKYSRWI